MKKSAVAAAVAVVEAVVVAVPTTQEAAKAMTAEQLIAAWKTKSEAIRGLHSMGFTAGEISKMVGVIYQHARNVILRPLKRKIKAEREARKVGQ